MSGTAARLKRAPSPPGRQPAGSADQQLARQRYVGNLAALYRTDSALAQRIEAIPFSDLPPLEPARDGNLTVRVTADDGKPLYLHSRYRPAEEARGFVEAIDDADHATFLICGMGLGYHLLEFARAFDNPLLIVAENDLRVIKLALCCCDLAELIREGRVVILTSADTHAIHDRLQPRSADVMLGAKFAALPHTPRIHAEFHARMAQALADFVSFCRMQLVTLLQNARITCRNIANNLPAYVGNPGVEVLESRAKGYPAILVAAGPSLARNVDQLNALRDRAVIICVQTVFKSLLARGCPPHFVTSLDFHEISSQFFDGVDAAIDTALVAEPKATWHVLDRFPGRRHVLQNRFADALLRSAAPRRGSLKAGATVAHLSFYLAEHLGCDPIILVGQDLAYSEAMYYPPGLPIERVWGPELNRFCTIETKQQERLCRGRPIMRRVKDIHGRDALTDDQLFTYARQFEADFAASPARVIHACEGGMRLSGVQVMTLREAAERFCTRPLPAGLFGGEGSGSGDRKTETERRRDEETKGSIGVPPVRVTRDRGSGIGYRVSGIGYRVSGIGDRGSGVAARPPSAGLGHVARPPSAGLGHVARPPSAGLARAGIAEPAGGGRATLHFAQAREALAQRLAEVRAIRDIGQQMSGVLQKLESLVDRPAEFNRLISRVDELRTRLGRYDHTYSLVIDVSQQAELRRLTADRDMRGVQRETSESARRRLRRDREFVESFLDGCAFLEKVLPEAIGRLEGSAE